MPRLCEKFGLEFTFHLIVVVVGRPFKYCRVFSIVVCSPYPTKPEAFVAGSGEAGVLVELLFSRIVVFYR